MLKNATKARKNFLSWEDTFIMMANLIAQRSKDPETQTGAVIVDNENIILGLGYNGWPRGVKEGVFSWSRNFSNKKNDRLKTKYPYVVHAEINAIFNSNKSVKGAKMYCCLFPCNECAKAIIQSGIKEIIYQDDRHQENLQNFVASKKLLTTAEIKFRRYIPTRSFKIE